MAQMSNDRRGVRGIGKNESSEIVSGERATYSPRIKPLRRNETSGVFRPFRPNNCFLKTFWTEVRNQGELPARKTPCKPQNTPICSSTVLCLSLSMANGTGCADSYTLAPSRHDTEENHRTRSRCKF